MIERLQSKYEAHPAAMLFPMLDAGELQKLADDIRENGQLDPIVIYDEKILDGRNRYAACQLAGVEPRFEPANGNVSSPIQYVISKNLHRRHLTTSQRAAIAADMMPMLQEEARSRKEECRRPDGTFGPSRPIGQDGENKANTRQVAADLLQIGESSVERALIAKRDNPEGFEKVKRGEISVTAAAMGHKVQPPIGGTQRNPVTPYTLDNERKRQRAEAQKRRMVDGLSMVGGVCHGLENLDVLMATAACNAEEVETWATKAENHARELKRFAARLRGATVNGESE